MLTSGVNEPVHLLESNRYDTVLCGCIIDVDFDGENEILIGTYGQVCPLYFYRSLHQLRSFIFYNPCLVMTLFLILNSVWFTA